MNAFTRQIRATLLPDTPDTAATFAEAVDAIAPDLAGINWRDVPVARPAEILERYALPLELHCLTPHRHYSEAELLALADEHGFEITEERDGFAWRVPGAAYSTPRRFRTATGAALHGLTACHPRVPVSARATAFHAVAPWLAYELEQRGEIVHHTTAGVSVWAACGADGEATDDNPLLRDIFARAILRLREGVA